MVPVTKWLWGRRLERSLVIEKDGEYLCYPPWVFGSFLKASIQQKALLEAHQLRSMQIFIWSVLAVVAVSLLSLVYISEFFALVFFFTLLFSVFGLVIYHNGKTVSGIMTGVENSSEKFDLDYIVEKSAQFSWFHIIFVCLSSALLIVAGPLIDIFYVENMSALRLLGLALSELIFVSLSVLWTKILIRKLKTHKSSSGV